MSELKPYNETWFALTLLAAALACQAASGQCYIDAYGNRICPQPSYNWQPPQENIVQQSGWPDDRIVQLEDGGTAAFVTYNGRTLLLSCAHELQGSVERGQRINFRTNDGTRHVATVVQVDPRSDCSLLTFNGTLHAKPFPLSNSPLQPGERVYVAGFPMGRYRVRLATVQGDGHELALAGSATPGESGGPIINQRGEVVGVLYGDERDLYTHQSIGRSLCCGRQPIRRMLDSLFPNRSGAIIPRATPVRRGGSVGRPPLVPVQPVPGADIDPYPPVERPEPTIDEDTWEDWQEEQRELRDQQAQVQQQLQSLTVKIEGNSGLENRIAALEQSLNQNIELDNRILQIVESQDATPGPPGPPGPPGEPGETPQIDYDQIAIAVANKLTHSATITLLDGTKKTQTKPLSEPLEFIQHERIVKQ